jgi:hypothetical protein
LDANRGKGKRCEVGGGIGEVVEKERTLVMAWVASSSASASAAEDEALWGTTASDAIDEANLDGRRRERDARNEEKVCVERERAVQPLARSLSLSLALSVSHAS